MHLHAGILLATENEVDPIGNTLRIHWSFTAFGLSGDIPVLCSCTDTIDHGRIIFFGFGNDTDSFIAGKHPAILRYSMDPFCIEMAHSHLYMDVAYSLHGSFVFWFRLGFGLGRTFPKIAFLPSPIPHIVGHHEYLPDPCSTTHDEPLSCIFYGTNRG